jgi:hypothetical protein
LRSKKILNLEYPAFLSFLLVAMMMEPAEGKMIMPFRVAEAGHEVIRGENTDSA